MLYKKLAEARRRAFEIGSSNAASLTAASMHRDAYYEALKEVHRIEDMIRDIRTGVKA